MDDLVATRTELRIIRELIDGGIAAGGTVNLTMRAKDAFNNDLTTGGLTVTTTLDPLFAVAPPEVEAGAGGTLRTAAPPPGRTQVTSRSEQ